MGKTSLNNLRTKYKAYHGSTGFLCGCSKINLISLEVNDMFTWLQVVLCMQRSVHVMRESTHRDNTVRYLFWITKATNKCMSARIVNTLSLDGVCGMVMAKSHGRGLQYVISLKGRARQRVEFYMNGEMFSFLPLPVHTVFVSCLLKSKRHWFYSGYPNWGFSLLFPQL